MDTKTSPSPAPEPGLVDASGRPLGRQVREPCPRCGASPDRRVPSAGFGAPHDCCGRCGFEWEGPCTS